jgi:esterase/lipase superfamily enzyme
LREFEPKERSILVYIHGFNVSFLEAAVRAAQIGFDLKVPGLVAFFSWPSMARGPAAYSADEDAVAASEGALAEFLVVISRLDPDARIHILAHSMGNRALLRVLHGAIGQTELSKGRIGQILLAAPDVDVALFRQLASVYPRLSSRTTLYISRIDAALDISARIHRNQRTGYAPPVTVVPGIDTIEVTAIDVGFLGHSYYAEAAGVLFDIWTSIKTNDAPDRRPGLYKESTPDGENYWVMRSRNM